MKITAKVPVNLFLLEGEDLKKEVYLPFFEKKIQTKVSIKFEINQDYTAKAENVEFFDDDKAQKGISVIEIEMELTEEEEAKTITTYEKIIQQNRFDEREVVVIILNDLIDIYRLKTGKWWVERIAKNHIVDIKIKGRHERGSSMSMAMNVRSVEPGIKKKQLERIKKAHENNQEMPIFIEYYILSIKHINHGRYDLALSSLNIALESLIFLLSKTVLGEEIHENLIKSKDCEECKRPIYKSSNEILEEINKVIPTIDHEAVKKLVREVRRPNKSNLRNDITHGKIVFIDKTEESKLDSIASLNSFKAVLKIYKEQLKEYL